MKRGFHVFFPFFLVALSAVLANAAQLSLQTDPNDPSEKFITMSGTGTDTFVIPSGVTSFKVYDDGGKYDDYSDDSQNWLVLEAPSGYALTVSGFMDTEYDSDFFGIWNGAQGGVESCEQSCIPLFDMTSGDVSVSANSGRFMTLYFVSDDNETESGLDLTVTVTEAPLHTITLNSAQGGTVSSDKSEASQGDVVTLTLTPTGGNYISGVSVSGGGGPVWVSELGWYTGNTAVFVMPPFDVTVTPQFVGSISAAGGSFIELPSSGTKYATIPEGVTSFKVYDDGGLYGNYSDYADGSLVLTAPEGKNFMVAGQLNTEENYDYFFIYDGSTKVHPLVDGMSGENVDIEGVLSTGNVMTLYLSSDESGSYEGIDLTVSVIDASASHTVALNSVGGGTVSSDVSEAAMGETVTLTLTPSGNNLIAGFSVTDEGGGTVATSELEWYTPGAHTVSFTMPAVNVSVNAIFAENVTAESGAFINLPASGTKSVTIPAGVASFKVYDNGGKNGNYSNGAYGSLVLTAPVGFKLQVTGIVISESGYDELTIYEGDDELSEDPFTGYGVDVGTITSNGNEIRIFFHSDESETESGLDLTVTLVGDASASHTITLNGAEGGTISSNVSEAMSGETVTLTLTPSGNNLLAGVAVVTSTGDTLGTSGVEWYATGAQTVTFTMPATNVSVYPLFTSSISVESGAFINMPATGTRNVVLPAGVMSFKVYDDGGKYDDYGNNVDGKLVLTVPEGKVLMVNGLLESEEGYDFFSIYDGDENAAPLIDDANGEYVSINAVVGTGNIMTLYFRSDYGASYSGLDLTVMVVDPNANYSIALSTVTGGSVSSTKTSAKTGETIVLTLSPDANYMLNGLEVKGTEDGLPLDVGEVRWYSDVNTISFTMPNRNLTVTPSFTDVLTAEGGLYINMPERGTLAVNIPVGVQSFKVYDNGGKDARSIFDSRENVELRAPVGYRLQVEGSMASNSYDAYGSLKVYNGNSSADNILNITTPDMGGTTNVVAATSSENVMTLSFYADGWKSEDQVDLDLTVTLVPAEKHTIAFGSYTGGAIASDVSEAFPGETVTLTAHSATNYLLAGISVENLDDHSVKTLDATWNVDNTVTFTMPNANVKVTPVFTNDWTVAGGLYLRLPVGGSVSKVSVPAGVTSFKVYATAADDEHCLSDYSSKNVLEIASADERHFLIEGEISDNSWLEIYDGQADYDDYPLQYRDFYGNTSNNIGQYQSGGDTVTIGYNLCEGLDLTVTVGGTATVYTITLADADGGAVYSTMDRAYAGETVDLRFGHDANHILEDVRVEDGNGNSVVQLDMKWYSRNYKTFIMPFSDVVVTPVFMDKLTAEDGLFIDMQNSWSTVYAVVPDNVKSFKIYDDGGSAGNYSLGVHSELNLEAPEGYALKLTGTMTVSQEGALSIYDDDYTEHRVESTGDGVTMDVGPITGHNLQLYFNDAGKYGETYSGLDLTVTLVRSAQYAAVSVEEIDGEMVATIDGAYNYDWGGDVYIPEEIPVDTVIFNRDFSISGYSTIVLPFDINVSGIDGLKNVYEFDGIGLDASGKKEARMVDASSNLKAYTPYMIELEDNQLVFHGKLVLKSTEEPEVRKGDWVFRGALGKITWFDGHPDLGRVYGFAASQTDKVEIGQFVKAGKGAWINPFRAYMIYEPEDGPSINKSTGYVFTGMETLPEDINVVIVSRDANGEEHKKVIGGIDARTGEFKMLQTYDLKGRKLNSANGKPEARGVYYGKKKVVK